MPWLKTFKIGDIVILVLSLTAVVGLAIRTWQTTSEKPTHAIVRAQGTIATSVQLPAHRQFSVSGPLGNTTILVENYRVKITQDPGPKQYCVEQSWLEHIGDVGLCLPNQVSVQLLGSDKLYDTYSY